jgi:hypothetical protein
LKDAILYGIDIPGSRDDNEKREKQKVQVSQEPTGQTRIICGAGHNKSNTGTDPVHIKTIQKAC